MNGRLIATGSRRVLFQPSPMGRATPARCGVPRLDPWGAPAGATRLEPVERNQAESPGAPTGLRRPACRELAR